MLKNQPLLRVELRGELLAKAMQRYPNVDAGSANVTNAIHRVAQEITNHTSSVLTDNGLTEGKFFVLSHLLMEEMLEHDPPRPSDIAVSLGVTKATITGLLDGLERQGLIRRQQFDRDRRVLTVTLTDKSRTLLDEIVPPLLGAVRSLADCLSEQEQATLLLLLLKLENGIRSKPPIECCAVKDASID